MKPDKVWQIYELTWRDGMTYIGQTYRNVPERIREHKWRAFDKVNPSYVGKRIKDRDIPCLRVLMSCMTQEEADTQEIRLIDAIHPTRRLNRPTVRPRQKTPVPPRDGRYRCNWCGKWYPPGMMSKDSKRRKGIGYKCRPCYNGYGRVNAFFRVVRVRRSGEEHPGVYVYEEIGDAYAMAYRLARRWVELGFDISLLNAARMNTWEDGDWQILKHGDKREADDLIRYLAGLPPPPPPTFAEPGRMSCCGAPLEGDEPTGKYAQRHYMEIRNTPRQSCEPSRKCDVLYDKNGPTGKPLGREPYKHKRLEMINDV